MRGARREGRGTILTSMKHAACAALAAASLSVSLVAQTPAAGQPQQPPAPLPGLVAEVRTIYTGIHNNILNARDIQLAGDHIVCIQALNLQVRGRR